VCSISQKAKSEALVWAARWI